MGVGHLDIGTGIGGAQVFNPLPAVQMYGQVLAQRKAKQDADNKYLADTLAKGYDPSGLRNDADRQAYVKQYSDIKQQAIDSENEKDPMKKALALAQVRQQLGDLGNFADQSKKQGANEHAWAQSYMQNPNNWGEDALNAYRKSKDAAIGSDGVINDFTTLQRRVDPDKVDKLYQSHKDLLTKNMQYDNGTQTPATVAGKKGAYVVQTRGIPMDGDNGAFETTLHWATSQPDVQKSLQDRYPAIQADSPQATLGLRVRQYMNDMGDKDGIYDQTKPVFKESYKPEAPDKFYEHYDYELKHPRPEQAQGNQLLPTQRFVADMMNGNTKAGQQFLNLAPKEQFRKGEAPTIKDVNGYQVITVPDIITNDKKIDAENRQNRKLYDEEPEYKDRTLGLFGGNKIPWEQSDDYLKEGGYTDPYKVNVQSQTYTLDPKDPVNYNSQVAEIARSLKIPVNEINKMVGGKGGHGLNSAIESAQITKEQGGHGQLQQAQGEPPSSGKVRVSLNGRIGDIPLDKYIQFKKDNPSAQRL